MRGQRSEPEKPGWVRDIEMVGFGIPEKLATIRTQLA
jgi:hypothetical protein